MEISGQLPGGACIVMTFFFPLLINFRPADTPGFTDGILTATVEGADFEGRQVMNDRGLIQYGLFSKSWSVADPSQSLSGGRTLSLAR